MLILNDIHIGVNRSAGTTPATAKALKDKLQTQLASFLRSWHDDHLIIAGDLFDQFEIAYVDLLETYHTLAAWCRRGLPLTLIRGNHDASAKGEKVSSFQFLCDVLEAQFADYVQVISGKLTPISQKLWAIGHCDNQDLFDIEMQKAIETMPKGSNLILHCNYENNFAVESDHSLNLSAAQAKKLADADIDILLAHEHQAREIANVYVMGNQWPSSVADCLGNHVKNAHTLEEDADGSVILGFIETWKAEGDFVQVDWRALFDDEIPADVSFIRVTGSAAKTEMADVISSIAKFRSKRTTLVITNAVKIDGVDDMEELAQISFEDVKAFDVMGELLKLLEPKEQEIVKRLLAGKESA